MHKTNTHTKLRLCWKGVIRSSMYCNFAVYSAIAKTTRLSRNTLYDKTEEVLYQVFALFENSHCTQRIVVDFFLLNEPAKNAFRYSMSSALYKYQSQKLKFFLLETLDDSFLDQGIIYEYN